MKKPNLFLRMLLWLSSTNYTIYSHCSDNIKGKRLSLSLLVLVTGLLSGISCSYLIRTIFSDYNELTQSYDVDYGVWLLSLGIGLIWMTCIVLIDKTIIASKSRMTALLRIPLAIAIGFVIAKPIEVQLFSKAINKSLIEASNIENKKQYDQYDKTINSLDDEIRGLKSSITEHKNKMVHWQSVMEAEVVGRVQKGRTGIAGTGPAWEAANNNYILHKDMCDKEETKLNELLENQNEVKEEAKKTLNENVIKQSFDFVSQYIRLTEIQKKDNAINILAWSITLLFMLIELIPAIMKLTNEKDNYDHLELSVEHLNEQFIITSTNYQMQELETATQNNSNPQKDSLPTIVFTKILAGVHK